MSKKRAKFLCLDCREDTGKMHEHYFVRTEVWLSVVGSIVGMLCIGCLEKRLGRQLNSSDFTDCSLNTARYEPKSERLMSRMRNQA